MRLKPKTRRIFAALAASWLMGMYGLAFLSFARPAAAENTPGSAVTGTTKAAFDIAKGACPKGGAPVGAPCPPEGASDALETVDKQIIKPAMQVALLTALLNLFTFVTDRLAYEAAIWVATGGEGESPLFNDKEGQDAWEEFGLDIAGEAIGLLNDEVMDALNVEFDLCAPAVGPNAGLFRLSLQLGIKQAYQPREPRCDFQELRANWDSFIATTAEQVSDPSQFVLQSFAEGFRPGQNELSAAVGLNLKVHGRVLEKKWSEYEQLLASDGFKAVTDFVTGQVKTPASMLQDSFQEEIKGTDEPTKLQMQTALQNSHLLGYMFLHFASVFTNTLLSTLMNKVYTGFFDVQPETNPLDGELAAVPSREDVAARFASIITAAPTQIENYSALSEFVACAGGGTGVVRSINSCVLDSGFASAISRSQTTAPMTVQEAIDEGLLHGDWPLIPHEGDGIPKNQDPFCYTYGYCYGNLVKLRKARIIPVGWEIAASRNDPSSPQTLQEIVDGFDDCGKQSGGLDASHPWCHLIDPDWVLKYPETQCRAFVNGEQLISSFSGARNGACVDTPSCISENNDGECDGGYGYCVTERNVWRFRGEECPEQYASCLSFENTFSGESVDFLLNTVDYDSCTADNAGCEWYRTNKYYDDGGTTDDDSDDTYEWLPGDEEYVTADREDDIRTASSSRPTYGYTTSGGTAESYDIYAYEDRIYFNNNVEECAEEEAGCSAVYEIGDSLVLNLMRNPSFEDDEDEDGTPDNWQVAAAGGTLDTTSGAAYYGQAAYAIGSDSLFQNDVQLAPGSFYTLSFYAAQASSGGTDTVDLTALFSDEDGGFVDFAGTSVAGDCSLALTFSRYAVQITGAQPAGTDYERFECTFSVPAGADGNVVADIYVSTSTASSSVWLDAFQMELGEDASPYTEEYNTTTPQTAYLLLPPDYLGCTGDATDPSECDSYTQMCSAQDVGCNLYTPEDGDPAVPAIASELDECPSECVGYTTYKQEATDREDEDFPLYFIADRANSCSSQYVGCDEFTNLDTVAEGGEGSESYTYLRACVKTTMAPGSASNNESATFFTWEGSDLSGYQLVTWTLLESNLPDTGTLTFDSGTGSESAVGLAPCVSWDVTSEDTVVCVDNAATMLGIAANDECDEHDDIFDNPDCREFYDTAGNIHYRELPDTVAVSDDCHPYRFADSTETDCGASGGYWTAAGECRYFGLPDESTECPLEQAGCREYTGGAGRNATTVFSDGFEDGDLIEYEVTGGASVEVSNESVATDGHSLELATATAGTVVTVFEYLDSSDPDATYDSDDSSTCGDTDGDGDSDVATLEVTSAGCAILDSSGDEVCTVEHGDNGCGTLDDLLVPGKTYVLSFWAKGSGPIRVFMADENGAGDIHDFVDPTTPTTPDNLDLEGAWHAYELGPLDTTDFADFDDDAVLSILTGPGETVYIDNLTLKAVEENIAIIKDSWVVPSTCDQTPDGADSDQYYLGCEAYTDQNGNDVNLYQFSSLCSEEVVGCEAVYDTQNSDSAFAQVFNARCQYDGDGDGVLDEEVDVVSSNTDCTIDGVEYCTIASGETFCLFGTDDNLPSPLPEDTTNNFYVVLGPEAVVVGNDTPRFVVDNGTTSCEAENVGCTEVGVPTYSQEKDEVTSFESAFYLVDPDNFDDILCANAELFCEEWSSSEDGNFYFKDPVDQTCEYQTNITIDGGQYYGWFRTDTNNPCYYTDADGDDTWDTTEDAYLIGGERFGVWRNGDDDYSGWVAQCSSGYDLCTEFRDMSDTDSGSYPGGVPYYFTDDNTLSEESLTASDQCEGQVSQKAGCALFYDTNNSDLTWNASASYVASTRADVLFGDAPGSKQDPIDCNEGGEDITTPDGETVNLCTNRCFYSYDSDLGELVTPDAEISPGLAFFGNYSYYERSCYDDADCPDLETEDGESVSGECVSATDIYEGSSGDYVDVPLSNNANRVLKVYRDRECSAWLSCKSSQISWNTRTSKWETICNEVGLCSRYTRTGDTSFCTEWASEDPVILDASEYAGRDTTWNGFDYSGYALPDKLPISTYDQVNIAPDTNDDICTSSGVPEIDSESGGFIFCETLADDCPSTSDGCQAFDQSLRLAYNAGPCDMADAGWAGDCVVGFCETNGNACGSDADCVSGESCLIGYCQYLSSTGCASDDDDDEDGVDDACEGTGDSDGDGAVDFPYCDLTQGYCVDDLAPNSSACVSASDCTEGSNPVCTPDVLSRTGACYNDRCLTDIGGEPLTDDTAIAFECRGYPEADSPFPSQVVSPTEGWVDGDGSPEDSPSGADSRPYSFLYGFQSANVCAPIEDTDEFVANDECLCSYKKASYGSNAQLRYYPTDLSNTSIATNLPGVCVGGSNPGKSCTDSSDECGTTGSCMTLTRVDTFYGWDGYCLEEDTSIQIWASSSDDDRACLTWLPVDQLSGATDLYGKYLEAGFPPENTYYCAEIQAAADLLTSNINIDNACAELSTSIFGVDPSFYESWDTLPAYAPCIESVWCPDGYFAVMTGLGELAYTDGANIECSDGLGDDDCPFFCVPKGSYKTTAADDDGPELAGAIGDPCLPPTALEDKYSLDNLVQGDDDYALIIDGVATAERLNEFLGENRASPNGYISRDYDRGDDDTTDDYPKFDIYLIKDRYIGELDEDGDGHPDTTFNDIKGYYDDCKAHGVTEDALREYVFPFTGPYELVNWSGERGGTSEAFRGLSFKAINYAACTAVVQVASDTAVNGQYNVAWTDRVWADHPEATDNYTIQTDDSNFAYVAATEQTIFGRAHSPNDFEASELEIGDSYPMKASMCTVGDSDVGFLQTTGSPTDSCDSGTMTPSGGEDARPYYDVALNSSRSFLSIDGADYDSACVNSDCTCDVGDDIADCNFGVACGPDTNSDGDTICVGGPNAGLKCALDSTCQTVQCVELEEFVSYDTSGVKTEHSYLSSGWVCAVPDLTGVGEEELELLSENESSDAVFDRMRQIFAKAIDAWFYRDGWSQTYTPASPTDDLMDSSGDDPTWVDNIVGGYESFSLVSAAGEFIDDEESQYGPWVSEYDYTNEGDNGVGFEEAPNPPTVVAIGNCDGTHCTEGDEDSFTLNNVSSGVLTGSDGYLHATVSFFAYADADQMPIRNIIVDWGDSDDFTSGMAWPTTSQSGSDANTNYYKNHRGYTERDESLCAGDDWGTSSSACETSYLTFTNDYVCSQGLLNRLEGRDCEYADDGTGRLIASPCTGGDIPDASGACVFQPRVGVKDNWGWCAGTCDTTSTSESTTECYGTECNFTDCPGNDENGGYTGYCDDNPEVTVNPWVNYNGYIIVTP
jgi:hypothetical protein